MNVPDIITSALVAGVAGFALFGVGGALASVSTQRSARSQKTTMEQYLDQLGYVSSVPVVREAFVELAGARNAEKALPRLRSAATRCDALLQLLSSLETAPASAVKVGVISSGASTMDTIAKMLDKFYDEAGIRLERRLGALGPLKLQPVDRELRHAHVTLWQTLQGVQHAITMVTASRGKQSHSVA